MPPLPARGGARLRTALGFVSRRPEDGAAIARIYAYAEPPADGEPTQFDDLAVGDVIAVSAWRLTVAEISEDGVMLDLAPEAEDA